MTRAFITQTTFTAGELDDRLLAGLPGVTRVDRRGGTLEVGGTPEALLHLGHLLVERGRLPADLRIRQPNLEDAFFRLVEGAR